MPPKYITISWWQGLHSTNYSLIFCVTIMSLRSAINYGCTVDRSNIFSKSGGWLTRLRQHKTSIFFSLCHCRETQSQLEQVECLRCGDTPSPAALWSSMLSIHIGSQVKTRHSQNFRILEKKTHATHLTLLDKMCKYEMYLENIVEDTERTRFCRQTDYIYIYIYITPPVTGKYVKAYISELSRRYSRTPTVYSWQTETGKPYCNIEFLSNMVSILKTVPDK